MKVNKKKKDRVLWPRIVCVKVFGSSTVGEMTGVIDVGIVLL